MSTKNLKMKLKLSIVSAFMVSGFLPSVSSAESFTNKYGDRISYEQKCMNGKRWLVKRINHEIIERKRILIRTEYGPEEAYCSGHTRDHYDEDGRPNQYYNDWNTSHGMSPVTVGVLSGIAGFMLGKSGSETLNKTVVNKTVVNKTGTNKTTVNKPAAKSSSPIKKPLIVVNKMDLDKKKRLAELRAKNKKRLDAKKRLKDKRSKRVYPKRK